MAKINKKAVEALSPIGDKPAFLWDEALAGFGVKALPSGQKRFVVKYRSQGGGRSAPQRWLTLGSYGQLTPEQARAMAQQALAAVARGEDPQADKVSHRNADTFEDLWQRFETEHLLHKKPHTQYDYRGLWTKHLQPKFGAAKVASLSRSDADSFHKSLAGTPYQANRALALLSKLMSMAELWGCRPQGTNPCKAVARFPERSRNRYLTVAEIKTVAQASKNLVSEGEISQTAANAIELLLATGARVGEILSAQWAWLDQEAKVLRLPDSKTGAKLVYLSEAALAIIAEQRTVQGDSGYIFPSREVGKHFVGLPKSWAKICDRAGLSDVRIHDLRHTAASIAVGQGASLALIGKLLGHSQAQTTLRYAHVDTDPALKAANEIGAVIAKAFDR